MVYRKTVCGTWYRDIHQILFRWNTGTWLNCYILKLSRKYLNTDKPRISHLWNIIWYFADNIIILYMTTDSSEQSESILKKETKTTVTHI